jgi:hypothetical protein
LAGLLVHPGMVLLAFYFHIAVARQRDGKNTINGHSISPALMIARE